MATSRGPEPHKLLVGKSSRIGTGQSNPAPKVPAAQFVKSTDSLLYSVDVAAFDKPKAATETLVERARLVATAPPLPGLAINTLVPMKVAFVKSKPIDRQPSEHRVESSE